MRTLVLGLGVFAFAALGCGASSDGATNGGPAASDASTETGSEAASSADGGGDAAADAPNQDSQGTDAIGDDSPSCGNTSSDPHNCGACGHDCLDETCSAGLCQPTVVRTNISSGAFAIGGTKLYRLVMGGGLVGGDVGNPASDVTLATLPSCVSGNGQVFVVGNYVALLCGGATVQFVAVATGTVSSVPLSGIGVRPFGWARTDGTTLYYRDADLAVYTVSPPAGPVGTPPGSFNLLNLFPAFDPEPGTLYIAGEDLMMGYGVFGLPSTGGNSQELAMLSGFPLDLAANTASVFVAIYPGTAPSSYDCSNPVPITVARVPKAGGAAQTLASRSATREMLADDASLFIESWCDGSISRLPVTGGAATLCSNAGVGGFPFFMDTHYLYFLGSGVIPARREVGEDHLNNRSDRGHQVGGGSGEVRQQS